MKAVTQGLHDLMAHWDNEPVTDPRVFRRVYIGPAKEIPDYVEKCDDIASLQSDSVHELLVYNHVERVVDLPTFFRHCYRVLKLGCNMIVSGFYHRHEDVRVDPTRLRGLEEKMFFALAKDWRDTAATDPFEDDILSKIYDGVDFSVMNIVYAGEPLWLGKSDLARSWGHTHFGNVTRRIDVTLVKR